MDAAGALRGPLPAWDLERRHADVTPLVTFATRTLVARGHAVTTLDRLHEHLTPTRARAAAQHLTEASLQSEGRRALHRVLRAALPEIPFDALVVQCAAHFRILVPGDEVAPAPLHTDRGIGHGLDERNVWIALTPADGAAALHALSLADSLPVEATRVHSGDVLPAGVRGERPIAVERGDVLLFTPIHVHGARVVDGARTRVSIDVRLAPAAIAKARNPYGWIAIGEREVVQ